MRASCTPVLPTHNSCNTPRAKDEPMGDRSDAYRVIAATLSDLYPGTVWNVGPRKRSKRNAPATTRQIRRSVPPFENESASGNGHVDLPDAA
jgi:hypothetical protein